MTGPNFSIIRARLRYESLDDFIAGYTRFISRGGMFIPMAPNKLKPVGTTVRFQYLLQDGSTAMLGEGTVRQIQGINSGDSGPVGMLIKFTRLNRETKQVVDQVLAYKNAGVMLEDPVAHDLDDTPVPGSTLQGVALAQADEDEADDAYLLADEDDDAQPAAAERHEDSFAPEASGTPAFSAASVADTPGGNHDFARSAFDDAEDDDDLFAPSVDHAAPFAAHDLDDAEEDDLFAPSADLDDAEDDDLFAPSADHAAPFTAAEPAADDDPFGFRDITPVPRQAPASYLQPDSDPFELDALVSPAQDAEDAESAVVDSAEILLQDDAEQHTPVAQALDETPAEPAAQPEGHKRLGRTEAGLQIMAFDELPEDEAAGLAALDFGGDADDVDQMFDDVFGGGDLLDEDDAPAEDDPELLSDSDLLEQDSQPGFAMVGETALDGGQPLHTPGDAHDIDEDLFGERSQDLRTDDSANDEPLASLEGLLEPDADAAPDLADESVSESIGFEILDEEDEEDEEEDVAAPLQPPVTAGRAFSLDLDSEPHSDIPAPADLKPAHEDAGPSPDLLSVLGAIDEDAPIVPDLKRLTLGAGAQLSAINAAGPAEEDSADSLSALLAQAQQEIDARREADEVPAESGGDLFDDLLGSDHQLPPPPDIQPMFDIANPEPNKKKKGGFISKLFGKD